MILKEFGGMVGSALSDMKGVTGVVGMASMYSNIESGYDNILVMIIKGKSTTLLITG